jgi:hypothetical protein
VGRRRPIALKGTNDEEYRFAGRWARVVVQSALRGSWEVVNNQDTDKLRSARPHPGCTRIYTQNGMVWIYRSNFTLLGRGQVALSTLPLLIYLNILMFPVSLLMRLHDTCFICLSSNSALVVLYRAVKVLNRTVVTDPQTCAHVLQHSDIVTNH